MNFLTETNKPVAAIIVSNKAIAYIENSGIEGCGVLALSDAEGVAVADVSGSDVEMGEEVGTIVFVGVGVAKGVAVGVWVGVGVWEGEGCVEGVGTGVDVGVEVGVGVGVGSGED